jgi:hypothetical protein
MCSFPGCRRQLTLGTDEVRLRGEMAHIVASSSEGPRGGEALSDEEMNKYGNLILLCPNHHEEVDAEPDRYTSGELERFKAEHEAWVERQLSLGPEWREELSTVDYVNVPRMLFDPASSGLIERGERAYLNQLTTLRDQGFNIGRIAMILGEVVAKWRARAIPLEEVSGLGDDAVGSRVSFEETFRTKNMTGSEKQQPDFHLSGELEKDPHLYVKNGDRTIYLPLDPRWVTTATAFVTFTSGIASLAGVGVVRAISEDSAIISPLVIGGPPLSPAARAIEKAFER